MDNKKRLEIIKKNAAESRSVKDLRSPEISDAIHGLQHAESAEHQSSLEVTKHYASAIAKHLPGPWLKSELAALEALASHEKKAIADAFTSLEDKIQKKIVETHHLSDEAAVYTLLAKLSAFCRAILFSSD